MKMKISTTLILLLILTLSCKKEKKVESKILESTIKNTPNIAAFDFKKFKIEKGQIGFIKVGMTITEAEKNIIGLTKKQAEACDFGFDGGGKAYIYLLKQEPILVLVPKRDSDEILVIVAISKNLKTNNGLNPNSTVKEIEEKYTKIDINQDLMMNWEFMYDEKNNWNFVFMTDENNRIGEYKELEVPTKPIRTKTKMDWITIK